MTLLEVRGLSAGYGGAPVIRDVSLEVDRGEVIALLGPNGAGKTTTLLAICGLLPAVVGDVFWEGERAHGPLHQRVRRGLGYIPAERVVFQNQTVRENLRTARVNPDRVISLFPELQKRMGVRAGLLSGGEQQMLALGRTLARDPLLIVIDELSLGLAPLVAERLLATVLAAARDRNVGVLLVEQHIHRVLEIVNRAHILQRGRVVASGTARELAESIDNIADTYFASTSPSSL